jgi:hypothetical protein
LSYILEALKKLEEKRRRETAPYFLSEEYSGRHSLKKNFPWRYLIIFGLLLNLGIFLWLLNSWSSGKAPQTGMGNIVQKVPVQRPRDTGKESIANITGRVRQQQPIMKTEEGPSAGYVDSVPAASSQAPLPAFDDTLRNTKIVGMKELPLSIRQKLPDLAISGHFYDTRPSARLMTVGGRILHEGAAVAPGVTLERITPDGAVFSCDGIRFHKGVF